MDPSRFDTLTRVVSTGRTRRGAVAALGGTVSLLWMRSSEAKKGKGKKKGCKAGTKKCGKKCISQTDCCTDNDCDRCALETCQSGVCLCPPDFIRSNGVCGIFHNCLSAGQITTNASKCCSLESVVDQESGQERCLPGTVNCLTPIDCINGGPCRGFMCPEQYEFTVGGGC